MTMATVATASPLAFDLPALLEAHEPPEARALARDEVRLMASYAGDDAVTHTRFTALPTLLRRGDVLVVNESATVNAALPAIRPSGERVRLHLSQRLPDGSWVVELRRLHGNTTRPLRTAMAGEILSLPTQAHVSLLSPYGELSATGETRLWLSSLSVHGDIDRYLDQYGSPIRAGYVRRPWPLPFSQTIFA